MAIRMDQMPPQPFRRPDDVTIVWKGGRIAKLVFPSGKVVRFDCDDHLVPDVLEAGPVEANLEPPSAAV